MTRRLVLAMTALAVAVALALAVPLALVVANDQRAAFLSRLQLSTLSAASVLSSMPQSEWQGEVRQVASDTGARVIVVSASKSLLADSSNSSLDRSFSRPEITAALAGSLTSSVRHSSTLSTDLRFVAAPIVKDQAVAGVVRLTLPENQVTHAVRVTQAWLAAFVLAVMLVAIALAVLLARSVASPLRRLAYTARTLPEDLDLRADESDGPFEVRQVAHALNQTASKLQGILSRTQRVAADASHHLRTPLTGVRLRLEAIEDISSEPEVAAEAAAATAEVDRLTRRIEQVLILAHTDTGTMPREHCDASAVIAARAEEAVLIADERDLHLSTELSPNLRVSAGASTVAKIIDELMGNAMQYAQTTVLVRCLRSGRSVEISVSDDGPGVDESEWQSIFQRFSRGSAAAPGGSGLGLALVQESAREAGGDAYAERSELGGLSVHVLLPAE